VFDSRKGREFFPSPGSGAHAVSYPKLIGGSYLGVKRPGREAEHSPPSSAETKKAWSYTSTSSYVFVVWCLCKCRIRLYDVVLS